LIHNKEARIPFDIEKLNEITDGGVPKKTLNIIVGGINVGKTLVMCHLAGYNLLQGKNVLYITMEMGWQMIEQRIDLHLLDMTFQDYKLTEKGVYIRKISDLKKRVTGRLICKDYPTASVSSAHFRHLLHELEQKEKFKPDVVYIDYLNLVLSARMKYSAAVTNTYMPVKMVAEELRGLAVEFDYACWSATQLTRSGFTNSDPGMEDTAESFGLPATADFMGAIVQPEELEGMGQYMFIQWKNRYMSKLANKRFIIGVDLDKQKLYNCEQSASEALVDDTPLKAGEEPKFDTDRFKAFQ
jgi:archaellum biogenesis ATPase FlaH